MRIFKEESELEVWKQDDSGRFALLRIYPICRWSGQLGPKMKEGDRQAPEGFYTITAGQMNPNSNYYLAINTGFPNIYDRANGRTGEFLMIHGDCASVGCYAMTDEQIAEIYALARESFFGGQRAFQLEAFPFRMTPLNMARHRNSPHMAFWKMLKQGYDHFGVTHNEPRVAVCEKRYVFDAETTGRFSPAERCPDYGVPDHIAVAVREKQRRDDILTAELISRGMPTVPITTGIDGGMNPTFLAAIKSHGGPGATMRTAAGTIPAHVNPPAEPAEITGSFTGLDSIQSRPAAGVQVASADSSGGIGRVRIEERGLGRHRAQHAAGSGIYTEGRAIGLRAGTGDRRHPAEVPVAAGECENCQCSRAAAASCPGEARDERRATEHAQEHDDNLTKWRSPNRPHRELRQPLWGVALSRKSAARSRILLGSCSVHAVVLVSKPELLLHWRATGGGPGRVGKVGPIVRWAGRSHFDPL